MKSFKKKEYKPLESYSSKATLILTFLILTSAFSVRIGTSASTPSGIRLSWTQNATNSTIAILWETDSAGNPNEVQYGLTSSCEIGTTSGFSFADSWGVYYTHQVELTSLSPDTKYFYKVSGDSGEWSSVYNFTTAPDSSINWTFLVAGDSRSNYGDWDSVVQAMAVNTEARLLFFGGDIISDFDTQSQWYEWMIPAEPLVSHVPFISCKGNHEDDSTGDPWDNYLNTFAFPGNEDYFSFDYGNAHFIVLNSEDTTNSSQLSWLESDLQAASSDPSDPWIFVTFHKPPYSSGGHGSDQDTRDNFVPLFRDYDVDIVFSGHNHFYQRTYPLNCSNIDFPVISDYVKNFYYYPDPLFVIAGRAGAGSREPNNDPGWFVEETMTSELHYMKIDVYTNGSVHATARYTDNTIFDDFWIIKHGTAPPRTPPPQPPEQIHIATTGDTTEMVVTWVTRGSTPNSTVEYGTSSGLYDYSTHGSNHTYTDGGWVGQIHDVVLTGLLPDTEYFYRVGDESLGWSSEFNFTTPPDYHKNVSFAAYADHGQSSNAQATTANIIADSSIDLIVHAGDLSYANGNQPEWDIWFNQIEENVARKPYMIVAGNHELVYDINATLARFNMPYLQSGSDSEFYYSFNYSMIHFVAICSDVDYSIGSEQYNWLVDDLAAADSDRVVHPWIIAFSHRPMYSSNTQHGSDLSFRSDIEPLLDLYSVDLAIWGHDHAYERTYPTYQEIPSDTDPRLYISPIDTIHMVAGMGGAQLYTGWNNPQPDWSTYREADWGYVRVTVDTDGNLHSEFIRNVDGKVRDEFWIVKEGVIPPLPPITEDITLIPRGANWRYNETDPQPVTSPNWNQSGYDDSGWLTGDAPFGFGESVTYGTELNDNDGSYYFRKTFEIESVDDFVSLTLYVASDNDAMVYLNGILVDDDSGANHEFEYWNRAVEIPLSALQEGTNIIAAFVYNTAGSSDAYFDLKLEGEVITDDGTTLTLQPGWNLISLPYIQYIADVDTVFSSISGSYDSVQCYDAFDKSDPWKHDNIHKPSNLNDLKIANHTKGIWIHITDSVEVPFDVPGHRATEDQTVALYPGWNLVGYPSLISCNRTEGLNNTLFGTHVNKIIWYNSSTGKWHSMGENDYFEVGRGYYIHALTYHVWKMKYAHIPRIRISVPAYFSPGPLWDQAISDAPATAIMIMNPSNGPGSSFDQTIADTVAQAQDKGIKVLGYVYTQYGGRNSAVVKADIDNYTAWYSVDGIFEDEVSNDAVDLAYYQDLANYIRSGSGSFIMLNPGTVPDEQYMDVGDVVVVFEGTYASYAGASFPSWLDNYPRTRFSHLVYDTALADFQDAWSLALNHTVGYAYITDDVAPNPWDTLPSYWDLEVDASNNS
ncbi:MAG: metallophosphoesterase [Thermoplasmata archaeon]|nr:MAG: metallophosphoesterase [Thermoplasmata archaeon]